jgi:hypothetical protein
MHGSINGDNITVYFGIHRKTLEVRSVTATRDGLLSAVEDGRRPTIHRIGPDSDEQTEVILLFNLIETFCVSKRLVEDARTQRRIDELIDLAARLQRMIAVHPEVRKPERDVDRLAPLPRGEVATLDDRTGASV